MRVFQSRARFIVERAPSNGEMRRRSKQVQHARVAARRRPTAAVHHVRGFVALLVARISQERHGDLRCGSLPAPRGGRGGLSTPGRRLSRTRRRLADRLCRGARFRGRGLRRRGLSAARVLRARVSSRRGARPRAAPWPSPPAAEPAWVTRPSPAPVVARPAAPEAAARAWAGSSRASPSGPETVSRMRRRKSAPDRNRPLRGDTSRLRSPARDWPHRDDESIRTR